MQVKDAISKVLNMEPGEGVARISCHLEVEQSDVSIQCRQVFEVQKKSGLCFIGPNLKEALLNSEMEDDDYNDFDQFDIDLNNGQLKQIWLD